jgi:Uma2 family endonuclease
MVANVKPITIEDFAEFVAQPENSDRLFELINGEILEVSPGRTSNSEIGHWIAVAVHLFCREHHLPCHTSGGDGAYRINDDVVAPDFACKPTPMSDEYPDPEPALWAVEIISPTDKAREIRNKRQIYLQAGILYWEIYPQSRSIDVYVPGQPPRTFGLEDTLDGADVLPNFTFPVKTLFSEG